MELENKENIVYGRNAVRELLKKGTETDKIFVIRSEKSGSLGQLIALAHERHIPVLECDKSKLDKMTDGGVHQGICAVTSSVSYVDVDDILKIADGKGQSPFIVIADGIEDPHNLGAIIRTCECAGLHGLIIPKRRCATVNGTAAKASAGAVSHLPIAKVTNIPSVIDDLKKRGVWVYGAEADGTPYYNTKFDSATAIVVGSEGAGISRLIREKCDFIISIPMYGNVNSFNVSCAAAVLLCEASRQMRGN